MTTDRSERARAGAAARKRRLLDDWDPIRAAQHMLEVYGQQAFSVAEQRAQAANDIRFIKHWRAIGATIKEIEDAGRLGSVAG
jgi:hypothetical protein